MGGSTCVFVCAYIKCECNLLPACVSAHFPEKFPRLDKPVMYYKLHYPDSTVPIIAVVLTI